MRTQCMRCRCKRRLRATQAADHIFSRSKSENRRPQETQHIKKSITFEPPYIMVIDYTVGMITRKSKLTDYEDVEGSEVRVETEAM